MRGADEQGVRDKAEQRERLGARPLPFRCHVHFAQSRLSGFSHRQFKYPLNNSAAMSVNKPSARAQMK
jgi:hypothetical protein